MEYTCMQLIGQRAQEAAKEVGHLKQQDKNRGLLAVARELRLQKVSLLTENKMDIERAQRNHMKPSLIDRLMLTEPRIQVMADGLEQIAKLEDPIGEMVSMKVRPNEMQIGKRRVPLGVIGIIYESRPNVTADAFGLCFKTGNVTILRGGSDSITSNIAIVKIIRKALKKEKLPEDAVILVEDTSRECIDEMLSLKDYIDVLIPRGGIGLIQKVVAHSLIPVIETGTGNCHIYVDEYADLSMAVDIIENAKTQRFGVCNACESLVIHRKVAEKLIPMICERLYKKGVEIRGDQISCNINAKIVRASEKDWGMEYLDAIVSLRVVESLEQAIHHINQYNTKHSEAIITESYHHALKFQDEIDAAAVYVNASTRFTDGYEFGFGAELGISTQKLHVRGPMGLEALTTTKYVIFGNGQVRN